MIYFSNPWRDHGIAYAIVFLALALLALWRNPFRGQPRSALLLSAAYAVAAIVLAVKFLHGHRPVDALWAGAFSVIGIGWWFWFRYDSKFGARSSATRDGSLETNHD
jgi:hypothetical protein